MHNTTDYVCKIVIKNFQSEEILEFPQNSTKKITKL